MCNFGPVKRTGCCMQLVVKSQVLAGGRGLGTFKNGLKGGVHIVKKEKVEEMAGTSLSSCFLRSREVDHASEAVFIYVFGA